MMENNGAVTKLLRLSIETVMKKIICIEGPDNIGKSTLCNAIAEELDAVVFHLGAPKAKDVDALQEQLETLSNVYARMDDDPGIEVWDRSVIGESVYGPMFREYNHEMYWNALQGLKRFENNIFFIVMYADAITHVRWDIQPKKDEKKAYQKRENCKTIATRFVDVATELDLPNTLYINCNNYESMDERNEYVMKRVRKWMKAYPFRYSRTHSYRESFFNIEQRLWVRTSGFVENRYQCQQFKDHECKIGEDHRKLKVVGGESAYPIGAVGAIHNIKYIFIGEASGYQEDREQLLIPLYNGMSGCIFQEALDECRIHPTQYYLTNVIKCNPKNNKLGMYISKAHPLSMIECAHRLYNEISDIMKYNHSVQIIAIGKVADTELTRMHITHKSIYHPSYYQRIGESWKFRKDLKALIGGNNDEC